MPMNSSINNSAYRVWSWYWYLACATRGGKRPA